MKVLAIIIVVCAAAYAIPPKVPVGTTLPPLNETLINGTTIFPVNGTVNATTAAPIVVPLREGRYLRLYNGYLYDTYTRYVVDYDFYVVKDPVVTRDIYYYTF